MPAMELTAREHRVRVLLTRTADWVNGLVASIGVLGLVGWIADIPFLRTFGPASPSLSLATACCLLIAAGALAAGQKGAVRGVRVAALVIALIALATLLGHAAGVTVGTDLRFTGLARGSQELPPPMSIPMALSFIAVAVGIALLPVRTAGAARLNLAIAAGVIALAFVALVGLTFRVLLFYAAAPLLGMALPGAIAFLLLGVGLLAGRPDPWLLGVLTSDRPGAVITRWLLPAAVAVPLAAGWARMAAERYGLMDAPLGAGLLTLVMIAVLGALILWIAHALDRSDLRRKRAEEDALQAYAELDRRVIERTAALERATATVRERTALLETITGSTPDLIWAKDLGDRILTVNAAWLKAMGMEERDAVGHNALDFAVDRDAAQRGERSPRRRVGKVERRGGSALRQRRSANLPHDEVAAPRRAGAHDRRHRGRHRHHRSETGGTGAGGARRDRAETPRGGGAREPGQGRISRDRLARAALAAQRVARLGTSPHDDPAARREPRRPRHEGDQAQRRAPGAAHRRPA